jgi:hypothetical protein
VQIVPKPGVNLYSEMGTRVKEIAAGGQGTFSIVKLQSSKKKTPTGHAKWKHTKHKGWIKYQRTASGVVVAEVKCLSEAADHWKMLQAFIGWLDRNLGDKILNISLQYLDDEE